jgi:predicted dehydrogenase
VLVEKPLGTSVAEAAALRDRVHAGGLVLQVGTMRRFDAAIQEARRFVEHEMGAVFSVKAWYCDSTHRSAMTDALQPIPRTSASARRPLEDPDGERHVMLNHGSHLIDLARFLGGDIVRVHAQLVRKAGALCWFVACEFADGAAGHLDLTRRVRMDWHEGFEVHGEQGSVLGRGYQPWYLRSAHVECFSERDGHYHRPLAPDGHVFRRQVEGFARTILDGTPQAGSTVDDGLAALAVMDAIEASVGTRAPVAVARP